MRANSFTRRSQQNQNLEDQPRKQSVRAMFADLFSRIRPNWPLVAAAIVAVLFVALIEFAIPQLIQITIDVVIPEQQTSLLGWIFLAVVVGAVLLIGFQFTGSYLMAIVGQRTLYQLRNDLYTHIQSSDVSFFDRNRTGDLMSRITNDVNMLQQLLSSGLLSLITDIFIFFAISIYMFYVNWQLATLILITFPILFGLTRYFAKKIRRAFAKVQASLAEINSHLQDTFSGTRLVKSFAMEKYETLRFAEKNEYNRSANVNAARYFSLFGPLVNSVNYLGMAIVVAFGAWQTIGGEMTVGMIATFLIYLRLLQNPIRRISRLMNTIQQAAAAYDRIMAVLNVEPEVREVPEAKELAVTDGEIRFEHVSFSYDDETSVLHEINTRIEAGKTTALVGASGSGKTTLIQLILRFYDPDSGHIHIDGERIDQLSLSSLRSQVAVVSQDVVLFSGTIKENIAYGNPEATAAEIEAAARAAHADEFITALPAGYDATVGERGVKLSGGQKQRISIARALLKNPPIILLDEATSALDTEAEQAIQAALESLLSGRTVLVIAHRLSTIRNADHIIVLNEGRIIEEGDHDELVKRKGRYRELNELQFRQQKIYS